MISHTELTKRNRKLGLGNLSQVTDVGDANSSHLYGPINSESRRGSFNFFDVNEKSERYDIFNFIELMPRENLVEVLHLPMNTFDKKVQDESSFNRIAENGGVSLSLPLITSNLVRPGAKFAGFFAGSNLGYSSNGLTFPLMPWNKFTDTPSFFNIKSFALEAWAYISSDQLSVSSDNGNTNTIMGVGGPDASGWRLAVRNTPISVGYGQQAPSNPVLIFRNEFTREEIVSTDNFPINQWVKVGFSYSPLTRIAKLYLNDKQYEKSNVTPDRIGSIGGRESNARFNVGRADGNNTTDRGWNSAWKGYLSDVKVFTTSDPSLSRGSNPFTVDTSVKWSSFTSEKELRSGIFEINGVGIVFDRNKTIQDFLNSLKSAGVDSMVENYLHWSQQAPVTANNSEYYSVVLRSQGGQFINIKKLNVGDVVYNACGTDSYKIEDKNEISNICEFLGLMTRQELDSQPATFAVRTYRTYKDLSLNYNIGLSQAI